MRLTLVRHAESESNRLGRYQGQGDCPLSAHGRAQAAALGARLRDAPFDLVVSSDLTRAKETAEALGAPLELDPAWREIHIGRWEGLSREEVDERYPDEVQALRSGRRDAAVGGGESWLDVQARVLEAVALLRRRMGDEGRVLVFAHGGVLHTLVAYSMGVLETSARPLGRLLNTSMCELHWQHEPVLVRYNDADHIDGHDGLVKELLDPGRPPVFEIAAQDDSREHASPERRAIDTLKSASLLEGLRELSAQYESRLVGCVDTPERIQGLASNLLGHGSISKVTLPARESLSHVQLAGEGEVVLDFNVGAPL
ncbi:MAG: histidine phosphatase family protein [Myxococcota bacterium]